METLGIIFCVLMMCSDLSAENTESHQPPVVEIIPDNFVTRLQYLEKQFIEQQLETRKQNELILSALDRLQQNQESKIDQLKSELNRTLDKIQKNVEIHFLNQESLFHQRNDDVKQTLDSFQEIVESRLLIHESKTNEQNEELKQSLLKLQRTVESDLLKQPSQNDREIGELNHTLHSLQDQQNSEFKQSIENLQKTVESKFLNQTSMINEQTCELNRSLISLEQIHQKILSSFPSIQQTLDLNHNEELGYLKTIKDRVSNLPFIIRSCKLEPSRKSGPYLLQPYAHLQPFVGYCEQDTFDGGWLVFQSRFNGSVNFYRDWSAYKYGFGQMDGEFWLGLQYLHFLTKGKKHSLLVELKSFDGKYAYARYDRFEIGSEDEKYALKVLGAYSGTAGDSLTNHVGQKFSTYDNNNDQSDNGNCAKNYNGAWWFKKCHSSLLNGEYLNTKNQSTNYWSGLQHKDSTEGFKLTRMMVREN